MAHEIAPPCDCYADVEEQIHYCALHASAPALLAALKAALAERTNTAPAHVMLSEYYSQNITKQIDAAINQAEGRT